MFSVENRERVRERLVEMARADPRVTSAAAVGGSAEPEMDRWSDIDLTFGLAEGVAIEDVLRDWTRDLENEFGAVTLFDLPYQSTIYRVFLLPGSLQVDLSFTPGADFGALGPKFALLFGTSTERQQAVPASAEHLFGMGVHHAVRGRICIERGRMWQAEYWISAVRDHALMLACLRHGLAASFGRGFDALPADVREPASEALARSLDRPELLRSLRVATDLLFREADAVVLNTANLEPMLRDLVFVEPD